MTAQVLHPNFPHELDIRPLALDNSENGSPFNEKAQKQAIQQYGIAGRIWEAAQLMTRYFQLSAEPSDWELDPVCSIVRRNDESDLIIVELGSGTGYVGLKLAEQLTLLGRTDLIVLTDLPDVCTLLEETLRKERQRWKSSHLMPSISTLIKILPLPWGDIAATDQFFSLLKAHRAGEAISLTHIVCSDLVYFPHLLAPLLRTLLRLTSPPFIRPSQSPEIIFSYEIRSLSKETAFWAVFGLWFSFSSVLARRGIARVSEDSFIGTDEVTPQEQDWHPFDSEGYVFVGHRRPESFDWIVPNCDSDLLAGVGARGSNIPKSDDAFETLLMMQMDC